jgi:hypothetical protein
VKPVQHPSRNFTRFGVPTAIHLMQRNAKHSSRQLKYISLRDKITPHLTDVSRAEKKNKDKPERSARFVGPAPPSVRFCLLMAGLLSVQSCLYNALADNSFNSYNNK